MSAEKIKNKILQEANNEANKILDQAKKEAKSIGAENKKQESAYEKKRQEEIDKEIKLYKDKTMAQARLRLKREFLAEREQIINQLIEEGAKSIDHSSAEYKKYLKNIIDDNLDLLSSDVIIYCNKKDKTLVKNMTDKDIKDIDIDAGIVIEDSEGKRIDESMSAKLHRLQDTLRQKIMKKL
ncbi:MAG: V-type ATP synthase subunit E [Nanoarchaeota archaeon]